MAVQDVPQPIAQARTRTRTRTLEVEGKGDARFDVAILKMSWARAIP